MVTLRANMILINAKFYLNLKIFKYITIKYNKKHNKIYIEDSI